MKLLRFFIYLTALWLHVAPARAQGTCPTMPQPACSFLAIDELTHQPVDALCVGRKVSFEPCPGRGIPPTLLLYGVLPGVGTLFPGCTPPNALPFFYTPTRADVGMVTVSELSNVVGKGTYYVRTFRVNDNLPPAFTVAPCPTGAALVTVTDTSPYDRYTVQAGTGPAVPIARNVPQVVSTAGATTLTVTGLYAATSLCTGVSTQPIGPATPPQTPVFTQLQLQGPLPGSAATLSVGGLPPGYLYTLQADAGTGFADVMSLAPGSSTISLPAAVPACYRVFRNDYCGTSPAASPPICTLSLAGTSARNRNQLLLSDRGAPGTTYTLTRNGAPYTTFTAIPGGLEDADVVCGSTYTYVVTATQPGGGAAVSNPVAIATVSATPPQRPRLLASFNPRDVVELTSLLGAAPLPAGSELRYRRSAGLTPPVDFATATSARVIRDSTALATLQAAPPCYTVRMADVCGNVSAESAPACPSLLSASAADPEGATILLSWTPFSGPDPAVPTAYSLQRLGPDGAVLSTVVVSGTSYTDLTPPTDRQTLRYRLQASGAGLPAGTVSYSNRAGVTRRVFLAVPTAFTPNGDGLNDVLDVKGRYLRDYTFVVVDRNGQEVFRGTQRREAWDGTIRGHAPVLGAYTWRFQQNDEDGKPFVATGSVTILK